MVGRRGPRRTRIVFVNGAEIPFDKPRETDRHLHHRRMNAVLDRVVRDLPNATVCDVRTFLSSRDDFTDNIRHYHRRTYLRMAEEIRASGNLEVSVMPRPWTVRATTEGHRLASRSRAQVRRLVKRLGGESSDNSGGARGEGSEECSSV